MTLREKVARAISAAFHGKLARWHEAAGLPHKSPSPDDDWQSWLDCTDAVLTAIGEAGFVVVPRAFIETNPDAPPFRK